VEDEREVARKARVAAALEAWAAKSHAPRRRDVRSAPIRRPAAPPAGVPAMPTRSREEED